MKTCRIEPAGESALYVYLGDEISVPVNLRVYALKRLLDERRIEGVGEVIPAYHSLLVQHDPFVLPFDALRAMILSFEEEIPEAAESVSESVEIPVCYGGEYGPDLPLAAELEGKSEEEVKAIHRDADYRSYLIGFAPGQPYLGRDSEPYSFGRRDTPRTKIPAGSVVVQKNLCCILPIDSPCGWNVIGRTPLRLFDPTRKEPFLLKPGQNLRFREINEDEFMRLQEEKTSAASAEAAVPFPAGPFVEVLRPGLLTSVQDGGIAGMESYGISPSGAMDLHSLHLANLLAGNPPDSAALEITLQGPVLRVSCPAVAAVCGADFELKRNGEPLPMRTAFRLQAGDMLSFGACRSGCRAYLAFSGSFGLPSFLGSLSTTLKLGMGGFHGRKLEAGDLLPLREPRSGLPVTHGLPPEKQTPGRLRVLPGPQAELFSEEGLSAFYGTAYAVTPASNRQGCRLSGKAVTMKASVNIISEGIVTGAVQVPPDGQPIIMTAERQTCGGYPKIATVIAADLPVLAQCRPGDLVRFEPVSPETALAAAEAWNNYENALRNWLEKREGSAPEQALESMDYQCEIIEE